MRSSITAKALSVSVTLSTEKRQDYTRLNEEVLKAYEITPEFYRVKFWAVRKSQGQKYAEFAHNMMKVHDK